MKRSWKKVRYRLEYVGLLIAAKLLVLLPHWTVILLGRLFGAAASLIDRPGRKVGLANLECAFGNSYSPAERRRILREAIDGLSPREREIIRRRHYDGESYAEIALGLGITVNHVGVLLYTAENQLREIVSHQDPELFPQGHV